MAQLGIASRRGPDCPLLWNGSWGAPARGLLTTLGLSTLLGLLVQHAAYAEPAPAPSAGQARRTEQGKPDLQGVWSNASITTLQRAARYTQLQLDPQEVAAATAAHPQVVRQQTDDNLDEGAALDGKDLQSGRGYNAFWIDPGTRFGYVKGTYRTSWIIDPADGQIPYAPAGREYLAALARRQENFDGPETRPLAERCLSTGARVGPPMINGLYNNNYEIFQTADHIVIRTEMVSHARVVRLHSKHVPSQVSLLFGDSIGRWEGNTLVVETTGFHPLQAEATVNLTTAGKVTERFTRVSAQELLYEFTVEDPFFYSRPWRGELTFNASTDRVFEYACHEGNYALTGILAGARQVEIRTQGGRESN
jgi:hypothetical protein